tara:strand:+ start:171 stop:512 length:342 start_codon:yes stop_codon:yes gene_type:complete
MTLLIIGLSLSIIAIGILFYLNYKLKQELEESLAGTNKALITFQEEFSTYQVMTEKMNREDITSREIRFDRVAKSIQKNEDAIYAVNKTLPRKISEVVSQIEFAKPINKNTNI